MDFGVVFLITVAMVCLTLIKVTRIMSGTEKRVDENPKEKEGI